MISLIYFISSLLVPNLSWNVKPVTFDTMKSTLTLWRDEYHDLSFEYNSTFEMIAWHETITKKGCLGLYHNYELRALSQVYRSENDIFLRSVITPEHEDTAGTVLMYKVLQFDDIKIDWEAIQKNSKWYIAALFIK